MKDDIDSILDSMFKGGKLNFGSVQDKNKEMNDAIEALERLNSRMSSSLSRDIASLTKEAQDQLREVDERLAADQALQAEPGRQELSKDVPSLKLNLQEAFDKAESSLKEKVVGQEEFVKSLSNAFKRPLVVGVKPARPSSCSLIIGQNGTGRHFALENFAKELQSQGILNSGDIAYIDLSRYQDSASEKSFVQDIYAAVNGKAQVIAFEQLDRCHSSVLKLISDIYLDGKIMLGGRYVEQKGVLVDTGSALVKNPVSDITAVGKYMFIITDKKENKLMDMFGAKFLSACDDVCRTKSFSAEEILLLSDRILAGFCRDAEKSLGCKLSYDKFAAETLAAKFVPSSGIWSLSEYIKDLRDALEDYKLHNSGLETGKIAGEQGALNIHLTGQVISISGTDEASDAALAEIKKELEEIIGLSTVKDYIYALEDNFKVQQLRKAKGMKAEFPSMHMIFTGNPGTGKTTIARIVSRYLKAIGVLSGGQLIEVTRADLVGRYVGHTAPMTQKVIQSALGGVLFVDEAYALYRGKDDSFGLEAIDTLVKGIEDNRDNLVVILAGYSMEMEEFLNSNSGLKSRFPNLIEFPDYTAQELVDITKSIVSQKGYLLEEGCEEALYVYYDIMQKTGDPRTNGNGRMARNKVEEAILNCSKRNISEGETANLELLKLEDFNLRDNMDIENEATEVAWSLTGDEKPEDKFSEDTLKMDEATENTIDNKE